MVTQSFLHMYRQLIELKEKENGPNHQSVAKAINNLAVIYCLQVNLPTCDSSEHTGISERRLVKKISMNIIIGGWIGAFLL